MRVLSALSRATVEVCLDALLFVPTGGARWSRADAEDGRA